MPQPRVSVLLPVYNVAPWLPECLDSILAQTMKDFELICVNDGSTDNSLDILKEYALSDSRIHIYGQENRGLSGARNTAAHFAKGEWLYFMDSDDKIKPTALEELCTYGEAHDLQLVYMNVDVFADSPEWEELTAQSYEEYYRPRASYPDIYTGTDLYCLFRENQDFVAPVWTYMIRHAYYKKEELSFYPGIAREDETFHRRALLHADRVGKIDSALICYRIRGGSLMTNKRDIRFVAGGLALYMELRCHMSSCTYGSRLYWNLFRDLCQFMEYTLEDYHNLSDAEKQDLSSIPSELRPLVEVLLRDTTILSDDLHMMKTLDSVMQANHLLKEQYENESAKTAAAQESKTPNDAENLTLPILEELDRANREIIRLQTTLSYRLGRAITAIPRKIRDTLKKQ